MTKFEYKVVPAPKRGDKVKGVKTNEGRFAHTLESLMNDLGAQGWEYQRADTLPAEERSGLTSKTTVFQNVLVFRRALEEVVEDEVIAPVPSPLAEPKTVAPLEPEETDTDNAPPVGPAVHDAPEEDGADTGKAAAS